MVQTAKELRHICAVANLCVQLPSPPFYHQDAILANPFATSDGPATIDSPTVLLQKVDNQTKPGILRPLYRARLATIQANVSQILTRNKQAITVVLQRKSRLHLLLRLAKCST